MGFGIFRMRWVIQESVGLSGGGLRLNTLLSSYSQLLYQLKIELSSFDPILFNQERGNYCMKALVEATQELYNSKFLSDTSSWHSYGLRKSSRKRGTPCLIPFLLRRPLSTLSNQLDL